MCDCKNQVRNAMLENFIKDNPESKNPQINIGGYALVFKNNTGIEKGFSLVTIKSNVMLKNGTIKSKTIKQNMIFTYCPFCGLAYEQ